MATVVPAIEHQDHYCAVVQSVPPYCYDFLQIFALPSGFSYRHRYDNIWVDPAVSEHLDDLQDKSVLIAYWDVETQTLIPVRWGEITLSKKVGRICYFEYRFGDLIRFDDVKNARKNEIEEFNRAFTTRHGDYIAGDGQPLKICLFKTTIGRRLSKVSFDNQYVTQWGNLLDEVAKSTIFRGVEFLKIVDLHNSRNKEVTPLKGLYHLTPGTTYQLRVFQFVPNPLEGIATVHDVQLNCFADQIQVLRNRQTAVGKYDVLTYIFRVLDQPVGERTALEILPTHPNSSASAQYQGLYIPIFVEKPRVSVQIAKLLVFFLSIGLILLPKILSQHSFVDMLGVVGIVTLIISLIGLKKFLSMFEPFKSFGGTSK